MRHTFRALVPAFIVASLLVSGATAQAHTPTVGPRAPLADLDSHASGTSRAIALGLSITNVGGKADTSWPAVQNAKNKSGRYPALWSIWSTWTSRSAPFPTKTDAAFMANLKTNHIVPIIVWQPSNPKADFSHDPARLKNVIAGEFDGYITKWAKDAKAYGSTVILRFAQEMNGSWNPWGVGYRDNTGKVYIKAWKHVRSIFTAVKATNVKFLWSPYQPCGAAIGCVPYADVFPGDSYVDYIGYSSFNWATADGSGNPRPWTPMSTVMKTGYKKLKALSSKPIIVAELASNRVGGDQATWITKGYPAAYSLYPQIAAIVYFDIDMTKITPTDPTQANWTFTPGAWAAYKQLLTLKHFRGVIN